jgi:hypothetical protein
MIAGAAVIHRVAVRSQACSSMTVAIVAMIHPLSRSPPRTGAGLRARMKLLPSRHAPGDSIVHLTAAQEDSGRCLGQKIDSPLHLRLHFSVADSSEDLTLLSCDSISLYIFRGFPKDMLSLSTVSFANPGAGAASKY